MAKRNKYAKLSAVYTADSFFWRKGSYNTAYCGDDRCGGRHRADGDRLRRSSRFDAGAAAFVWCGYGVRPINVHLYCADGFACVEFRRKTNFRFIALPIAIFSLSSIVMINLIKSLDLRLIGAPSARFCWRFPSTICSVSAELIPISLVGIVFILLDRAVGMRLVRQLNAEVIKRAIYLFVGISGAMTLIENIR